MNKYVKEGLVWLGLATIGLGIGYGYEYLKRDYNQNIESQQEIRKEYSPKQDYSKIC